MNADRRDPGLNLGPVTLGAHWRLEWPLLNPAHTPESRVVVGVGLDLAGEVLHTPGSFAPDPDDDTLAAMQRRTADLRIELSAPGTVTTPPVVTVTRDRPVLHFGTEAWGITEWRMEYYGRLYVSLIRDPGYDLPAPDGAEANP